MQGLRDEPARGRFLRIFMDGAVHDLPLAEGTSIVGRADDASIRIDDASVSRKHALIHAGVHLTVEDLGSANGTRIAGRPLAPHSPVLVPPGVTVELGRVLILIGRPTDTSPSLLQSADGTASGRDATLSRIAASELHVLVTGESGVGKEVAARRIHRLSARSRGPFVKVTGASISSGQSDPAAELAAARDGTFFLDELLDLDVRAQDRVLAALEHAAAGGLPRIVSSSRRDVDECLANGSLSAALYYRLAHVTWLVPPLRTRIAELQELATEVLAELATRHGRGAPLLADDAVRKLSKYAWPGNVRELYSALERALLVTRSGVITSSAFDNLAERPRHSPEWRGSPTTGAVALAAPSRDATSLKDAANEAEYHAIVEALRAEGGNQTRAAKRLGISRGTLVARLSRYELPRPRRRG